MSSLPCFISVSRPFGPSLQLVYVSRCKMWEYKYNDFGRQIISKLYAKAVNTRQIRFAGCSDKGKSFQQVFLTFAAVSDEPVVHFAAAEIVGFGVLVVWEAVVAYPLVDGAAGVVARKVVAQLVYVHPLGRACFGGGLFQPGGEFFDAVAQLGQYGRYTVKGDSFV